MADTLDLHHPAGSGESQTGGDLRLILNNLRNNNLRVGSQAAAPHLLGVTHQFVEMDSRRSYECAGTRTTFDNAFAFQSRESVAGGHQANSMNARKFALGAHGIPGLQLL